MVSIGMEQYIRQCSAAILLLSLFHAERASGTHLVGGELTYEYVGLNAQGENEFEVHCYIYRDCSSNNTNETGFDPSAAIGVYQQNNLITTASGSLNPALVIEIIPENPNNCAFLPEDLCIERAEYIINVSLPASQQEYTIVHQRCCRSPVILNLTNPEEQGFSLVTTIPASTSASAINSTPIFDQLPQAFVCSNYPFSIDNSATDPDGDSLSYSISPLYLGGFPLEPIPNPPTGPPFNSVNWAPGFAPQAPLGAGSGLTIDPVSGVLSASPGIIGKFVLGIVVTEWRNGQPIGSILRDFTMDVVACNILSPGYDAPDPCSGLTINFDQFMNPSDTYVWDFGVADADDDLSAEAEPQFTYDEPGVYDVSLFFETGSCSDSMFFEVVVHESWNSTFEVTDLVCFDGGWLGQLEIDDSNWTPYMEWEWNFGVDSDPASASNVTPDEVWFASGSDVTVELESSAFTCEQSADFVVELPDLPLADFEIDYEPCSGLDVSFVNLSPNTGPFFWNFGTGLGTSTDEVSPVFTYPSYGSYEVELTAGQDSDCADVQTLQIDILPEFPFDSTYAVQPFIQCDESGFVLLQHSGAGVDELTWDFPGILSSNELTVQAEFPSTGVYSGTLTLYNEACDLTAAFNIEADVPQPLSGVTYQIPNVISPNNDGQNDSFSTVLVNGNDEAVSGLNPGDFYTYNLSIYNRWGTPVFESLQAGKVWRPAPEVPDGTYYVVLSARHICDETLFNYTGELSVVR